jgi:pimeloyl-ACP methyl ester carboxylesterase
MGISRHYSRATLILLCSLGLAGFQTALPDQLHFVAPVTDSEQGTVAQQALLCRPMVSNAAPLVVYVHGSPPSASDRPNFRLVRCHSALAKWFTSRGYAFVSFLRPGYGVTGGESVEGIGHCTVDDYVQAGQQTARDIDAVVNVATTLPGVQSSSVIVIGVSAGGWGTIAYDSLPHQKVGVFISMAGGRGGHQHGRPYANCHPENLAAAAGELAKTATAPMLWVYAENDTFFPPPIAKALADAFMAGGGRLTFDQVGPFGDDGHHLFGGRGGDAIWGPIVAQYLRSTVAQ